MGEITRSQSSREMIWKSFMTSRNAMCVVKL